MVDTCQAGGGGTEALGDLCSLRESGGDAVAQIGGVRGHGGGKRREGRCPKWLLRKGRASVWDPLFSRGVPALPKTPGPPPDRVVRVVVDGRPEEGVTATGDVYTDGALTGKWRRIMRGDGEL